MAFIEAFTPDVFNSSYDGAIRFNTMVNTTQTETMVIKDGRVSIGTASNYGRRLTIEAATDTTNDQLLYLKQTPDNYGWSFNINGSQTEIYTSRMC